MQPSLPASPEKRGESEIPDGRIQRPSSKKPNQEPTMNSYQAATPRTAISIAAVVMTALTLGLSILPAKVNSGEDGRTLVNASRTFGPAAGAIPGEGMPIVVYGVREQETAMQKLQMPHVVPPQKQQG